MRLELRIALVIVTLIYLFIILKAIKHKKMQISFSLFWIFTGVILVIAALIPNLIGDISTLLGFQTTANMIFCAAIFMAFFLIFKFTISLSKESKKNIKLIQEISILKKRVDELEKNNK